MKKTVSAGIIIFRKTPEGLKYLLLYKGKGYWNFPKGKIEGEERSWQTALREIKEETGLRPNELKFQSNFKAYERFTFRLNKENIFRVVILYLAETHQPRVQISPEHEGFGWFTFSEAKKMLSKHKEPVAILMRAHRFLLGDRPRATHSHEKAPMPQTVPAAQ